MTAINPNDFRRWAYGVARDMLASAPASRWEIDDLVQEALVAIWQAAPKWANDGRASHATYVTAAARRRMAELVYRGRPALGEGDRTRAHGSRDAGAWHLSVERELELVDMGLRRMPRELTEEPADISAAEAAATVRAAVDALPEKERRAVVAVDLCGLSSYEAAPSLGVTASRVRALRTQAHGRLREQLGHLKEAA